MRSLASESSVDGQDISTFRAHSGISREKTQNEGQGKEGHAMAGTHRAGCWHAVGARLSMVGKKEG